LPDGVVCILMTHSNLAAEHLDIRLDLHMTIERVKEKFRMHIGTSIDHQRLILKENGHQICEMSDNTKMLGFYSVVSGMEIHVIDTDPFSLSRGGGLTDVSLVQKYKMDDEIYDKRKGTMREFIRQKREADPNFKLNVKGPAGAGEKAEEKESPGPETVEGMIIGARCELTPGARRGTVKFIGEISKSGWWIGIQLDEPSGLHDGSAKGVRYFECPMNYGTFARGKNVKVGDYPERDILDDDDDEDDEKENTNNDDDEDEI